MLIAVAGEDGTPHLDEAIRLSFLGQVVPLASRCSVHCKSDITHKLNRHEATPADVLHTLHDSMANKVAALLERSGIARDMYSSLNVWLSRTRGGIAIVTSIMAVIMVLVRHMHDLYKDSGLYSGLEDPEL